MTLTRTQTAQQRFPSWDWQKFETAQSREAALARAALAGSGSRRLGTVSQPLQDTRTEEEKMNDKALVKQGEALIQTANFGTMEQVQMLVIAAYGSTLTAAQINAMTAICFTMGLDPSPAVGHVYAYTDSKGVFRIVIGYQGYIQKAREQHEFIMYPPRPMTDDERYRHGLRDDQLGAICEVVNMREARMAQSVGLPIPRIVGSAVWNSLITWYDKSTSKTKSRPADVPNGRTGQWVAEKSALKDALRKLGLSFGSFNIPQVNGFNYDAETDSFTEMITDHIDDDGELHEIITEVWPTSVELPDDLASLEQKRGDAMVLGEEVYGKQWKAMRTSIIRGINSNAETVDELSEPELNQLIQTLEARRQAGK